MTTITDAQYETIKDRFRDFVTIALYDATKHTQRQYDLREDPEFPDASALFAITDKLCKQSLARMGVTAIGDELLWKDPR